MLSSKTLFTLIVMPKSKQVHKVVVLRQTEQNIVAKAYRRTGSRTHRPRGVVAVVAVIPIPIHAGGVEPCSSVATAEVAPLFMEPPSCYGAADGILASPAAAGTGTGAASRSGLSSHPPIAQFV